MMRTVPSASAILTVATTVARWEGELDEAVYCALDDGAPTVDAETMART